MMSSPAEIWTKAFSPNCEWRDNLFPDVNWRYYLSCLSRARLYLVSALLLSFAITAGAQESPTPPAKPSPAERSVRISFLPPPLDGTISLGIYDAKGKLVRVLHREADINEFNIGTDALSTTWDGKDDAGENVPAGKYSAHGFVVGDLGIEGVGFSLTTGSPPMILRAFPKSGPSECETPICCWAWN